MSYSDMEVTGLLYANTIHAVTAWGKRRYGATWFEFRRDSHSQIIVCDCYRINPNDIHNPLTSHCDLTPLAILAVQQ